MYATVSLNDFVQQPRGLRIIARRSLQGQEPELPLMDISNGQRRYLPLPSSDFQTSAQNWHEEAWHMKYVLVVPAALTVECAADQMLWVHCSQLNQICLCNVFQNEPLSNQWLICRNREQHLPQGCINTQIREVLRIMSLLWRTRFRHQWYCLACCRSSRGVLQAKSLRLRWLSQRLVGLQLLQLWWCVAI